MTRVFDRANNIPRLSSIKITHGSMCTCMSSHLPTCSFDIIIEMKQLSEAAGKVTISEVRDVPSQKEALAELGGLSEAEKKRLVAQYDCESDGDSEYPINSHLVLYCTRSGNLSKVRRQYTELKFP